MSAVDYTGFECKRVLGISWVGVRVRVNDICKMCRSQVNPSSISRHDSHLRMEESYEETPPHVLMRATTCPPGCVACSHARCVCARVRTTEIAPQCTPPPSRCATPSLSGRSHHSPVKISRFHNFESLHYLRVIEPHRGGRRAGSLPCAVNLEPQPLAL